VTTRTLLAGTALAVAALGTPAHAGCCTQILDIYVAHGAASVTASATVPDLPPDYEHSYSSNCTYGTLPPQSTTSTTGVGQLAVAGSADSDLHHGVWTITVYTTCTLYTTTGASYAVSAAGSRANFVKAEGSAATTVPGGLPVDRICVTAGASWSSTSATDNGSFEHCAYPGVHFADANEDLRLADPL
jgi:hypothetical protein